MQQPNLESQGRSAANNLFSRARSGAQGSSSFMSTFLYLLVTVLLFAVIGLGASYNPLAYMLTFLLVQVAALLLGTLHLGQMERWLPWFDDEKLSHGIWMTLGTTLAAALGVAVPAWLPWFRQAPMASTAFVMAVIPFVLPYFFWRAYEAWNLIPEQQYKLWYYKANAPGPDLARMDLNNFMVIHFWMPRRYGEDLYHDFSSKAPYEMRFSDLFHIFLTDYNVMKPDQSIQYLDEQGRSYGWLFYAKQPWWKPRRYYDPDYTFRDNFIRQGNIVVAKRIPV